MRRLFHGDRSIALTGRQAPLTIASCTRVPPIPLKGRQGVGASFDHTAVRTYQVRGHVSSEHNGTPNGAPPFMSRESVRSAAALQEVTEEILSEGPLIYCILITHGEPPDFIQFEVTVVVPYMAAHHIMGTDRCMLSNFHYAYSLGTTG